MEQHRPDDLKQVPIVSKQIKTAKATLGPNLSPLKATQPQEGEKTPREITSVRQLSKNPICRTDPIITVKIIESDLASLKLGVIIVKNKPPFRSHRPDPVLCKILSPVNQLPAIDPRGL
jgi:hypothetical protein